jgi:hypothetical protein
LSVDVISPILLPTRLYRSKDDSCFFFFLALPPFLKEGKKKEGNIALRKTESSTMGQKENPLSPLK